MCGICGFISKENIKLDKLKAMNDVMFHRGPNDSGEEIYVSKNGYQVGFAQRRLSILDLSQLGHQPMHSKNGRISVVFNGEIYNFKELKEELREYLFASQSDTEVIIASYLKWGIKCVERFRGMFAIAIYDRETEEIFLIRDRIGKKPLYYWWEGENLFFASELKPFYEIKEKILHIDKQILARFLYQKYINAPNSIFENVFKLEPGSILKFKNGKISNWKYWDIKERYVELKNNTRKSKELTYKEAKSHLKDILSTAVKERMVADVPIGTFLSGGYDSSLITALAQTQANQPVNTFSIGFQDEKINEAGYAKAVAKYLGTNHTELYIDEAEMFQMVEKIPIYYDEPFADSSQIPSMLVASLAKKEITVALTGDGGDELFCGYDVYDVVKKAQYLDVPGSIINKICNMSLLKYVNIEEKLPFSVKVVAQNRDNRFKTQISSEHYIELAKSLILSSSKECKYDFEEKYLEKNWRIRRMLLDMDTYLPGDILCKVDRATMAYSVEARCPILDVNIIEFALSLPQKYKCSNGNKKRIIKDITHDYIPKELMERPKAGFGVPLDKWLRGPLKVQLQDLSSIDYLKKQEIFAPDKIAKLVNAYLMNGDVGPATGKNFSNIVWSFFVFQKWYQKYVK